MRNCGWDAFGLSGYDDLIFGNIDRRSNSYTNPIVASLDDAVVDWILAQGKAVYVRPLWSDEDP
jgi:hypothetical protein